MLQKMNRRDKFLRGVEIGLVIGMYLILAVAMMRHF